MVLKDGENQRFGCISNTVVTGTCIFSELMQVLNLLHNKFYAERR